MLVVLIHLRSRRCEYLTWKFLRNKSASVKVAQSCPTLCSPMDYQSTEGLKSKDRIPQNSTLRGQHTWVSRLLACLTDFGLASSMTVWVSFNHKSIYLLLVLFPWRMPSWYSLWTSFSETKQCFGLFLSWRSVFLKEGDLEGIKSWGLLIL